MSSLSENENHAVDSDDDEQQEDDQQRRFENTQCLSN